MRGTTELRSLSDIRTTISQHGRAAPRQDGSTYLEIFLLDKEKQRLEIEASDLRCSHGATVSQVDEDMIYYLMSRGIPRNDAVRLIVEGFFQPSLDRLPESLAGLRGRLNEVIGARLRG